MLIIIDLLFFPNSKVAQVYGGSCETKCLNMRATWADLGAWQLIWVVIYLTWTAQYQTRRAFSTSPGVGRVSQHTVFSAHDVGITLLRRGGTYCVCLTQPSKTGVLALHMYTARCL